MIFNLPGYRVIDTADLPGGKRRIADRGEALEEEQHRRTHAPAQVAAVDPAHHGDIISNTYKVTQIVGTSPQGIDAAIRNGVQRASQTLRNLDWFEVTEVRGHLEDGEIQHFQVGMKIGFHLGDAD